MDRRAKKQRRYLRDIIAFAESIVQRAVGETAETFIGDPDFHDAVYYRLQCVSEAVRNLLIIDPTVGERYSEIPWERVRSIGNVIRHEYGDIETSAIWEIVVGDRLRDLLAVARLELKRLGA